VARDAAIVSDIAGTTRDVIDVPVAIGGIAMVFTDTAGVHDAGDDVIERIGIERAQAAFETADILLWLGPQGGGPYHAALIEIDSKADLDGRIAKSGEAVALSAKTGAGMAELIDRLIELARDMLPPENSYASNARQRTLMLEAANAIEDASASHDMLITGEQLRIARLALDALTGRSHTEDLLDTVFGKFCIGK
jgi:tRNA modification GTPase